MSFDFDKGSAAYGTSAAPEPVETTEPQPRVACDSCPVAGHCVGNGMAAAERHTMPLIGRKRLRRGQVLFRAGEGFGFCYEVRSGTLKSTMQLTDGREQVAGFHFPGELLGADAVAAQRHPTTAIALEDSEVCTFPASLLREGAASLPDLRRRLWALMALDVLRERELVTLVATSRAEQRVAAFLVHLGARMKSRGYSSKEFHLRMSRADIGSYLGLTVETVSRAFTAFADAGLLDVRKKHVRVVDAVALESAAAPAMRTWMSEPAAHA